MVPGRGPPMQRPAPTSVPPRRGSSAWVKLASPGLLGNGTVQEAVTSQNVCNLRTRLAPLGWAESLDFRETRVLYIRLNAMRKLLLPIVAVILVAGIVAYAKWSQPTALELTGIVTTNDVIVSPQISGQISQLLVNDGDQVKRDQLLAVITPDELRTDIDYYAHTAEGLTSQVKESQAALRFQQQQTADHISQAEATLASTVAQEKSAEADRATPRLT